MSGCTFAAVGAIRPWWSGCDGWVVVVAEGLTMAGNVAWGSESGGNVRVAGDVRGDWENNLAGGFSVSRR